MNTTYFLNCTSGNVFGTQKDPVLPTKYYVGLSISAPQPDGSNVTEPSPETGYKRVELTTLSTPLEGVVSNSQAINFDESTGSWGTVTHFVIFDTATDGNLLMFGELPTPRNVEEATIMTIKEGYLTLSVTNPA